MASNFVSKDDIVLNVKITDLAKEFGIQLEDVVSSKFNYRCRCPSPNHKNGYERTPSCYINSQDNDFICYGCNASLNSIDFYMLCTGLSFGDAMGELKKRIQHGTGVQKTYNIEENNYTLLLEISKLFRKTMLAHSDDLYWINKLMLYTDSFILEMDPKDVNKAKYLLEKIQYSIKKRYEA